MARDPRFDVLFEPVRIGPVTAPNRFYQVPHCAGMGYASPQMLAAMRGVKAEGGWGVVCTEYCSVHPSSEDDPMPVASLWDDEDVRSLALFTDEVHAHGALAGAELWHGGNSTANFRSREEPVGARSLPAWYDPAQCRALDKAGIRELRRWHVLAPGPMPARGRRRPLDVATQHSTVETRDAVAARAGSSGLRAGGFLFSGRSDRAAMVGVDPSSLSSGARASRTPSVGARSIETRSEAVVSFRCFRRRSPSGLADYDCSRAPATSRPDSASSIQK